MSRDVERAHEDAREVARAVKSSRPRLGRLARLEAGAVVAARYREWLAAPTSESRRELTVALSRLDDLLREI